MNQDLPRRFAQLGSDFISFDLLWILQVYSKSKASKSIDNPLCN